MVELACISPLAQYPVLESGAPCDEALARKMLGSIKVKGRAKERQAVAAIVCRLTESRLGRELGADWAASGLRISLSFADIEATDIVETSSGQRIRGTSGITEGRHVALNSLFLRTRELDVIDGASTLAHELFGHIALEAAARRTGVHPIYSLYCHDAETYSSLVGWIVSMELGRVNSLSEARLFLRDRAVYEKALSLRNGSTARLLAAREMNDPYGTYRRRRSEVEAVLRGDIQDPSYDYSMDNDEKAQRQLVLNAVKKSLDHVISIFEKPGNEAELRVFFQEAAKSEFFQERSRLTEELARRFGEIMESAPR